MHRYVSRPDAFVGLYATAGVVGFGLALGDELVQLAAFTSDERGTEVRVARPSRRR